jgi:TfoX N-terminal domain
MARDRVLEEMIRADLGDLPGLGEKAMFGGLCWLLDSHMLCAASKRGMMIRLGKGEDGWALAHPDVATVTMGDRAMPGWVRVPPDTSRDDGGLRRRLIERAIVFVHTLPPK